MNTVTISDREDIVTIRELRAQVFFGPGPDPRKKNIQTRVRAWAWVWACPQLPSADGITLYYFPSYQESHLLHTKHTFIYGTKRKRTDRTKRIEKDTDHRKRRIKKNGYSDTVADIGTNTYHWMYCWSWFKWKKLFFQINSYTIRSAVEISINKKRII
jgi:hypothetical protein